MIETAATFKKTHVTLWRDRLLALGLMLLGMRLVSLAFHAQGHEIICLIAQIAACVALLAAAGLSIYLLSEPTLQIDKVGISESGFLFRQLNWSMSWNEISHAELAQRLYGRVKLFGEEDEEPQHILHGYDGFGDLVKRIRQGLWKYGRPIVEDGNVRSVEQPK